MVRNKKEQQGMCMGNKLEIQRIIIMNNEMSHISNVKNNKESPTELTSEINILNE